MEKCLIPPLVPRRQSSRYCVTESGVTVRLAKPWTPRGTHELEHTEIRRPETKPWERGAVGHFYIDLAPVI